MPSKGVDYFGFVSDTEFSIEYKFPEDLGFSHFKATNDTPLDMFWQNYQISETSISIDDLYGKYTWTAMQNGSAVATNYAKINPLTGNLDDSGGMISMLQTPSIINAASDYAVSYGFYDAGSGIGNVLTDQDQSYVYVTKNLSNWMYLLAAEVPGAADKPFSMWALPGVHDSGMFDPTEITSLVGNAEWLALLPILSIPVLAGASETIQALINMSFTQKDNITTMLELGIRYFDFRPGYNAVIGGSTLYHQHNFIPGYPLVNFLNDVVAFLANNPTEIVVVNLNSQGFYEASMAPSQTTLDGYVTAAMKNQTFNTGDKTDLASSYNTLIKENTRLIFLNQIGPQPSTPTAGYAVKYDSYSASVYQTTDVSNIIGALNGMNSAGQAGNDYTVLQLQGTAEATGGAWASACFSLSDSSSPIISTKANFDNSTYPWLYANVINNLLTDQLVVFLNDFGDNALVNTAFRTTTLRMQAS